MQRLRNHRIQAVADVRRHAGSRKYPHFGQEALASGLREAGLVYEAFPELGGRRRPRPNSRNSAWRNTSFRGYADYMETEEFRAGVARLIALGQRMRTAVMCAEAVWWRCHRALISDHLKAQGVRVLHIMDEFKASEHPYTSAARLCDGVLTYEPQE